MTKDAKNNPVHENPAPVKGGNAAGALDQAGIVWPADIHSPIETLVSLLANVMDAGDKTAFIEACQAAAKAPGASSAALLQTVVAELSKTDYFQKLYEHVSSLRKALEMEPPNVDEMDGIPANVRRLFPFIKTEFEQGREQGKYEGLSLAGAVLHGFTESGEVDEESNYAELVHAAESRARAYDYLDKTVEAVEEVNRKAQKLAVAPLSPSRYKMLNNALVNKLAQKDPMVINAGAFDLNVAEKNGKKITAYTILSYEPAEGMGGVQPLGRLTEYERQVLDAVSTLWVAAASQNAPPVFTPQMIYRTISGGKGKPSAKQVDEIDAAVRKLWDLKVFVDITEEMRHRHLLDPGAGRKIIEDRALNIKILTDVETANGRKRIPMAYQLLSTPCILQYCEWTKQIITISPDLLDVRLLENGKITETSPRLSMSRRAMVSFLLRQIEVFRADRTKAAERLEAYNIRRRKNEDLPEKGVGNFRRFNDTITYSRIFDAVGIEDTDRTELARCRKFISHALDYWVAKGFISGYTTTRKGRAISGVKILY